MAVRKKPLKRKPRRLTRDDALPGTVVRLPGGAQIGVIIREAGHSGPLDEVDRLMLYYGSVLVRFGEDTVVAHPEELEELV